MSEVADIRFALVGAGGLGGPIAYALAAAGAGGLTVCDDDEVELSNLQRQVQFGTADLGRPKVEALADELARRGYPRRRVRAVSGRFEPASAADIAGDADVVIDGSDHPPTKFAVNDWAVARGRPYVIGAALRYGGQVWSGAAGAACYRCLFEAPPANDDGLSCAEAGVLGATVAVIGGLAARAALALAAGLRQDAGSLLVCDDLRDTSAPRRVRIAPRPGCPACAAAPATLHEETL